MLKRIWKYLTKGAAVVLIALLLVALLPPVSTVLAADITWAVTNPEFEAGDTRWSQVCELDTNKFVVVFLDWDDAQAGKARVGTVVGTTITWGDTVEFCSDIGVGAQLGVTKLDTDKFVVVYADDADGDVGKVILGNVALRTITFELPVGFSGADHAESPSCCTLSSTKFAIVYNDETSGDVGTAVICTVAADVITADTANALAFEGKTTSNRCCKLDTDKFVAFYADAGDNYYGKACAFSIAVTTPTDGAILTIDNTGFCNFGDCVQLDTDKFVAAWRLGKTIICTVDGALDITADVGGNVVFNGGDQAYFTDLAKIDATHFVVGFRDIGNTNKGTSRYCSFAGTTITLDGEELFHDAETDYTSVCLISANKLATVYQDLADANNIGEAIIGDVAVGVDPPTVTTEAADDIEDTTATGNGTVTDLGGGTTDRTGIVWDLATQGAPGDVAPGASGYANDVGTNGNPGLGVFDEALVGLPTGDTIYCRAYAHTENGYGYGDEVNFLTKPAAPTDVAATENQTDKVTITWTKSTGATDYHVWRDAVDLGASGDVATEDDAGATAGTITNAGTATATDGTIVAHVELSLAGEATGTTSHTYKVVASNVTGDSDDSATDEGYRTVGAITYAWQVSDADLDAAFNPIGGGTTDPYNYALAPANGDGRWYYCIVSSVDASNTPQNSTHDRGYRGVLPTVTVQAVDDISYSTATGNGNITVIGTDNCDERGFVWDLGTQGDPGDVAPGASGYAFSGADNGDYGIGIYDYELTGLLDNITYFVRAYTHNPAGYDYSNTEVNFKTLESLAPTVVTNNANVSGIDVILNGDITDLSSAANADYRGFVWDTATHANPGNVAPGISGYSDNWTEAGAFNTGAFDHEETGLVADCLYFYRASAHSADGWAYGDEVTFFTGEEGKVYLEFRPDLDETRIRGNVGIPTGVRIGEPGEGLFTGYSLPIWNSNDEELYFMHCVPDRWDGESHIIIHIVTALANANEAGNSYQLEMEWEHVTPDVEEVPVTLNTTTFTRNIESNTQFECYKDYFLVLYNADVGDDILADDEIAIRLRRLSVLGVGLKELDGELIILHWGILFARGDLLGDPDGWLDDLIEDGIIIGGEFVILLALGLIAVILMVAAFCLKRQVLAIGSAFAWLVFAGAAYIESAGDATTAAYWIFWFGIAMAIAMSLEAVIVQRSAKKIREEETAIATLSKEYEHPADRIRREHGLPPSEARKRQATRRREKDAGWD